MKEETEVVHVLPGGIRYGEIKLTTSSSAIAERLHCRVGQKRPKAEDDILQTIQVHLQPL